LFFVIVFFFLFFVCLFVFSYAREQITFSDLLMCKVYLFISFSFFFSV
jgi:hypothetical protein